MTGFVSQFFQSEHSDFCHFSDEPEQYGYVFNAPVGFVFLILDDSKVIFKTYFSIL